MSVMCVPIYSATVFLVILNLQDTEGIGSIFTQYYDHVTTVLVLKKIIKKVSHLFW